MNFSKVFMDRPIFASVLSILIVLVGAIAYLSLPIAQYPEVAPPTIAVRASYSGASPEVIADFVARPSSRRLMAWKTCSTCRARAQATAR